MEKASNKVGVLMIKQCPLLVILIVSSILVSCSEPIKPVDVVKFEPRNYQVLLYSNHENNHVESIYIDAILTLQREFEANQTNWGKEILDMQEVPSLSITYYPTLVILKDGEVVKKIYGPLRKDEILQKINEVLTIKTVNNS
jgi:thiol-disulfide isomerase/thioredoxin